MHFGHERHLQRTQRKNASDRPRPHAFRRPRLRPHLHRPVDRLWHSGSPRIPATAAVGMALLASGIHALLTPLTSSSRGLVATAQSVPVAAMAGIVAAIASGVHGNDQAALAT